MSKQSADCGDLHFERWGIFLSEGVEGMEQWQTHALVLWIRKGCEAHA